MSLQYELFQLSNSPQAQLASEDRALFDFYLAHIEQYASQGELTCPLLKSISDSVLKALTDPYNGFKISADHSCIDWSSPTNNSLSMKMNNMASNPYYKLSEIEKIECEMFKKACFNKANVGEKFIEITEDISPKILDVLGIPKNSKFFYWGDSDKISNL